MYLSHSSLAGNDYLQQAPVPLDSETHGIEDVAIFAKGPMSHLFHGVQEQSYIAHVMAFAGCLEPYEGCELPPPSHAGVIHPNLLLLLVGLLLLSLCSFWDDSLLEIYPDLRFTVFLHSFYKINYSYTVLSLRNLNAI